MGGGAAWFDVLRRQMDAWVAPVGARVVGAVARRMGGRPGGRRQTLASWILDVLRAPSPSAAAADRAPAPEPTADGRSASAPVVAPVVPPVGPSASPPADPWAGFVRLPLSARPREGEVLEAVVDGVPLAVGCVEGELFCVDSACPHAGGSLCDGGLEGTTLECPLHGWGFDVRSGACNVQPRFVLPVHAVRERDGALWVRLADAATAR
jgi:nitrite reductase/ring-hydroxylating ferredoxin subunit